MVWIGWKTWTNHVFIICKDISECFFFYFLNVKPLNHLLDRSSTSKKQTYQLLTAKAVNKYFVCQPLTQ